MTTSATITIPADYLEDARSGALAMIADDTKALRSAWAEDQGSFALILRRSIRLLDPLLKATGDTKLTAERDSTSSPLPDLLEAMIRLLLGRLRDVAQYGPMPMGDVADVAAELRWAAEEAIRIEPALEHRLSPDEWKKAID
jgi:hypothetical protein